VARRQLPHRRGSAQRDSHRFAAGLLSAAAHARRGPLAGAPRALELAWTLVAHTDSRFDPATLQRFVLAFQRTEVLRISELWAVPIALRLTLIENLRRLAVEIVEARAARLEADRLANLLLGQSDLPADPQAFRSISDAALTPSFAVRLSHRLRDQDPTTTPAARWLDERLAARGTSAHELIHAEHQRQAAANVTVRNVITSLRIMATFDWRDFFEKTSLVDRLFRARASSARWTSRRATAIGTPSKISLGGPGARRSTWPARR